MPAERKVMPSHPMQDTPPEHDESVLLAELAPMDGSHWQLCLHPLSYKRDHNPELEPLLRDAGATNPFFDPAVLTASRDRITQHRIHQLIAWETIGETRLPRLSLPVVEEPGSLMKRHLLRSFTHPYAPLGDPLLLISDGQAQTGPADGLLSRFVELLVIAFADEFPPLVLNYVSRTSPLSQYLAAVPCKTSLASRSIPAGERAAILPENGAPPPLPLTKKKLRELRRLEGKLAKMGDVTYERVVDPFDVLLRLEEFLLMEAKGWKGRRGTSIHAIKRDAAFARQSVMDLAKMNGSEIFTLRLNDVAIASIILLSANGHYYPWKICFNETFAGYSPGTQLMVKLTRDITGRSDFEYADSLAHFGRSWMSSLWPSVTAFETIVLAGDAATADAIVDRLELAGKSRSLIKKILGRV